MSLSSKLTSLRFCLIALGLHLLMGSVLAESYPTRPIRVIVTFAAGSGTDTIARVFGEKLAAELGQPLLIDNKPGANGIIGASIVAKAPPDGYTLLVGSTTNAVVETVVKSVPYDTVRDFTPISFLGSLPQIVVVNNQMPVKNMIELVAYSRANPGKVSYAWANAVARVASENLASQAGLKFYDVPYKSSPQAMTDLISGEVQLYISDLIVAMPHVLAGKVRALGVTSLVRSSVMPDVPTIAESGLLPKYEALGLFGLFGPAGLPPTILAKLNAAVNKVANDPELRNRLSGLGLEVQPSTPAELAARMSAEKAVWMRVTKAAGMSPQ